MKITRLGALLMGFAALLLCPPTHAAEWHVDCQGTGDFERIQEAIDASDDGDTVTVLPCTYDEHLDFLGKNIVVTSLGPEHRDETILEGAGTHPIATFVGGETNLAELRYFTIQNGSGRDTGGCIFLERSSATILGNVFSGCVARSADGMSPAQGGAICLFESRDYVIEDNEFIENRCETGDDSWTMGGAIASSGSLELPCSGIIRGNEFYLNRVQVEHGGHGGAMGLWHTAALVELNVVEENVGKEGGGIILEHSGALVLDNVFIRNEGVRGGGIYVPGECPSEWEMVIEDNTIEDNTAIMGGGILVSEADPVTIRNNSIINNQVILRDGYSWVGGGGMEIGDSNAYVIGNAISNNQALGDDSPGGGVLFWHSNSVFRDNFVSNNHSDCCGGGILAEQASPFIVANTFISNTQGGDSGHFGGGALAVVDSHSTVERNLFRLNESEQTGSAIEIEALNEPTYPAISDNTFVNNFSEERGAIGFYMWNPLSLGASIVGNRFHNNSEYCIYEAEDTEVLIADNVFFKNRYLYYDAESKKSITTVETLDALPEANGNRGR